MPRGHRDGAALRLAARSVEVALANHYVKQKARESESMVLVASIPSHVARECGCDGRRAVVAQIKQRRR
jgi:hypothetical protein